MKEMTAMRIQASTTKPINISDSNVHNIVPTILPFHHINTIYGKKSFIWNGPIPNLNIGDPKMIREIFSKNEIFPKPKSNSLAKFLPTALNRKMKSNYKETRALIKGIIHKNEKALKLGEASNNDDLLGKLIESNNKEIQEHGKRETGMSIDEGIEECKLFYLAGQETSETLLTWTMVLLCMHPHWQQLAREEVVQVFGNEKPKFDDLNHLKAVTKILQEALRLYSPATILTRMIYKETKLGEINLPPGILLSLPLVLVHHDHEYWGDDADEFSEGVAKASKNNEVSFFPFGW
ncbi:hypothetical protein Ddye_026460, partial [Dipteronia dyeriana]